MKVWCTGRKTAQDRTLDLANMVEFTVDQSLAEIGCGLASVRQPWWIRSQIQFAYRNARQITHIQSSQVGSRVGRVGVAGANVQRRWEGMISDIWCVMTCAAGSWKRGNAAGKQAPGRGIVVDPSYTGDVNGPGIENGLPARN